MIQEFNDFVEDIKAKYPHNDRLEVMLRLQSDLNKFIDSLRNIRRWDDEAWVKKYILAMAQEVSELIDCFNWKWWKNPKEIDRNAVIEEIVDIIHFLLSAYLQKGMTADEIVLTAIGEDGITAEGDSLDQLWDYFTRTGEVIISEEDAIDRAVYLHNILTETYLSNPLEYLENYTPEFWESIVSIANFFNITPEEIYTAYLKKNYENRLRQVSKEFRGGSYYALKSQEGV
jgi:dimeric dUTPase (all-alpha-NTP-PPase superfamily)